MNEMRKIDSLGRIQIPVDLVEFSEINTNEKIAICKVSGEKNAITLKNLDNLKNMKVIGFTKIETKGRCLIPFRIRKNAKKEEYEVYILNKAIVIQF